jgi:hypothetical protein
MANRTIIEIYTRQRTSLSVLYGPCVRRCEQCDAEVLMLSPDCAADLLQVTPPIIAELIARAALHTTMTPTNSLLICSNSILTASAQAAKDSHEKKS